ncbi:sigma-54-dependent Fis family transcriptional regulator [Bradyrhizobium sp. AUGA SZCCT0431]|uniref:sigma-54-dependent Fis family transcriptional regulator n=1 Tax=Bradyrhizobium sp. AUGA SZCCT0431 TaxID=2807674 RepID=UPI001BA80881|nr:sigma-54-dependent Fis family transcriptional regulator [Bradyrhizobium sp. AUGA SZCCT0431]MBR1146208.1 sigma-54-dependent Fis family transcriptional regulator [Bradyrhizobium sp. AUGA SZCCT0431]
MASNGASNHVARVLSAASHLANAEPESRIALSWRRCLFDHKLDPALQRPPQTFTESEIKRFFEPVEGLVQVAIPELEDLARVLRDSGYCVNFADTNGTMLVSRLPGGDYERIFRERDIYTGSNFSESCEGTNGVGTALAEQRPILVHRDEHFREQYSIFTCGVAPLFDHCSRLAGVLNITSCRSDLERAAHQLAFAIAVESARRIESSIFRRQFETSWIATLPGDQGSGLIAYDDDRRVVGACRRGRSILGLTNEMIQSGVNLSSLIQLDGHAARAQETSVELRRVDGTPLGRGEIARPAVARSMRTRSEQRREAPPNQFTSLFKLAGSDPTLTMGIKRLMTISDQNLPILLHGETGTGKDVFARAIHASSNRARNRYVALNCAAMPESLIDAELFGYEAGAFTGARREGSKGLIVQADGGTLFLDEIGDMPIALQTRLLRVLENREVWPLGASKPVTVDIKLISATHRDLARMANDGTFRADLYYRLRGLQIRLPALRDRADKADVISQIASEEAPNCRISHDAWTMLLHYPFPGNMRQLRHALRLAACTAEDGIIVEADLDLPPFGSLVAEVNQVDERATIVAALRDHGGRVSSAARALKLSRATLYRKIKLLKIDVPD